MKIILPLVSLLFIILVSEGQTREVRFSRVTGSNGIALGRITSITEDMHGAMWFTDESNKCITRYDGSKMKRYRHDPRDSNSLGGPHPECIVEDSTGTLWIGFYGTGLDRFDPETNTFTHFRHDPDDSGSLSSDLVSAILIDHLGNFWVGSDGGLDLFDKETGKFTHYAHNPDDSTSLSHNVIRSLYEDKNGEIWVGTGMPWDTHNKGGLNRFNKKTGTFTRYLSNPNNPHTLINNKVRAILEDSKGNFWVGTAGDGLHTLNRKTGEFTRHTYNPSNPDQLSRPSVKTYDDHITFIKEDASNKIWIGTWSNGAVRYDPSTNRISRYGRDADGSGTFNDFTMWQAYSSSTGLLWLCTQQDNTYQVDLSTNFIPFYEMNGRGVNGFYEESTSVFWIATDSGAVRQDLSTGKSQRFLHEPLNPNSLSNNVITSISKDVMGYLWFSTQKGLNRYDSKSRKFTRLYHDPQDNESLMGDNVLQMFKAPDSSIWVSTFEGFGLLNLKTLKFKRFQIDPSDTSNLNENLVTALVYETTDEIWLGSWFERGLKRMNTKTGKFKHYLPGQNVVSIIRDAEKVLWVATQSAGIFRYDPLYDRFSLFDFETAGFAIDNVLSMIDDHDNNLWITTSSSVVRLNQTRDELIQFDRDNNIINVIFFYQSIYRKQDGQLLLGGYPGYCAFYPDKLTLNESAPKILFTNFYLNNESINQNQGSLLRQTLAQNNQIELSYIQNVFSISFDIIDYSNPNSRHTYFKLENYDNHWRSYASEDRVYYFNVPPGKYTFKIKSASATNGLWSEKSIAIAIAPPWWRTWWAYSLFSFAFAASVYSVHRFQKGRVIRAERERARETELAQAKEIEKAYAELKATQSQLIQSEKMASLGELTAGIAHEIQNPLNFVNNFSEVNSELIADMKDELTKGNIEEAKTIADHIDENEKKIIFHGKRADGIVKGMLQHSRSSSGLKEPTDVNALADEYLRLAYHGLRAKDKSFNATMKTDFDENVGNILVVPQDMGRVILNLITNAFYAVSEKQKAVSIEQKAEKYEPTVSVTTRKSGNKVFISVKDNGNGIPQKVLDKIFQPFFTTKPAGQGTGLGLSLSYDIVMAHNGELKVETNAGEGSEFIIIFPLS